MTKKSLLRKPTAEAWWQKGEMEILEALSMALCFALVVIIALIIVIVSREMKLRQLTQFVGQVYEAHPSDPLFPLVHHGKNAVVVHLLDCSFGIEIRRSEEPCGFNTQIVGKRDD